MLRIQRLSVLQFKNYSNRNFRFDHKIVGICGNNGVGKTNLLDAIHYLCFTKSYFSRIDINSVQEGNKGFRIEGEFLLNQNNEKAVCILRETGKKEFFINDEAYDKFSRHIGRYPCVIIAPDDAQLLTGDSRERRSFIDALLSQIDSAYLQHLITYQKILLQRNSWLRNFAESQHRDLAIIEALDRQLIPAGSYIFNKRKEFFISFLPQVKHKYQEIAKNPEDVNLFYESELLNTSMAELLMLNRNKDMLACRTISGTHRDDLAIQLGNRDFKNIASQGQRKSLLFALKLAEMDILQKEKQVAPLLLLDDVFEKLDEDRISNLLNKVCIDNDAQVFITDTNEQRLTEHLVALGVSFQLVQI